MAARFEIRPFTKTDRPAVRRILQKAGWAEQYIAAAEENVAAAAADAVHFQVLLACHAGKVIGSVSVQMHRWNQLAQIQGLAVDRDYHRQGCASALVARAELFAAFRGARHQAASQQSGLR